MAEQYKRRRNKLGKSPGQPRAVLPMRDARARKRGRDYLARHFGWIDILKQEPCSDCGVSYPAVCMDFDHLDPEIKVDGVGHLLRHGKDSIIMIAEEISKCDLVCANCHRLRTFRRDQERIADEERRLAELLRTHHRGDLMDGAHDAPGHEEI